MTIPQKNINFVGKFSGELSLDSWKETKYYSGRVVAEVLRRRYDALVNEIDPERVAICLFGLGIINNSELESASNKYIKRTEKSNSLLMYLLRRLISTPDWGYDTIVALKKAEVNNMESIIEEIEGTYM